MSYTGFPPNEFALWLSQQVQQGNMDPNQALSNQLSIPQHPLPLSSRAASYPPTQQGQIPTGMFPTNTISAYPTVPFTMPYPITSFPAQSTQVPFPHYGASTPAYGSLENTWRSTPQYIEPVQSGTHPNESQQVVAIRTPQQNHAPPPYGNQSPGAHLTTIHPSLGVCVLVPIDQLRASAPPSFANWAAANNVGHRHSDYYSSRIDRLRRRHARELTPYMRSMTPSPQRSPALSPYLSSPSSSVTATPVLRHRRYNTPEFVRSPSRFHGIGGFTPLRRPQSVLSVPRPTREASISTVGTCSQCGGTGAGDSYEPFTDGSNAPTPRGIRDDRVMGQGKSSSGHGEAQEESEEERGRFQASVEEVVD